MRLFIEVTWDNGINGNDFIQIGNIDSNNEDEIILEARRYFGNDIEIITRGDYRYLKTRKGEVFFWVDGDLK